MSSPAICGVSAAVMSWPSNTSLPCDACHRPMMVRSAVVLPAPLRPSSMVSSPRGTARSTPCRMWYWSMCVCTPASVSNGSGTSSFLHDAQIGFLHHRRCDDFRRLAVCDELPLVQHDDAVGQRADHVHLVFHQQHG